MPEMSNSKGGFQIEPAGSSFTKTCAASRTGLSNQARMRGRPACGRSTTVPGPKLRYARVPGFRVFGETVMFFS